MISLQLLLLTLYIIISDTAVTIGFGELDYISNEEDAVAKVVVVVSESNSPNITVPLTVLSFTEFKDLGKTLPSGFDSLIIPDEAECKHACINILSIYYILEES